jgi:hypothetical protein
MMHLFQQAPLVGPRIDPVENAHLFVDASLIASRRAWLA